MSVQAIMIDIITEDQATINAIVAEVPLVGDARLISDTKEHQAPTIVQHPDFEGVGEDIQHLVATFRCITEADQAQITENIIGVLMGNITNGNIKVGSKIKLHLCFHDEVPSSGCEEQIMYEVRVEDL